MMSREFFDNLRANVQFTLQEQTQVAGKAFESVIVRPPEPTPQEIWQEFISKPAQEHQQQALQLGREEFIRHIDDMLTLGESLTGPSARNMMPYLEQFIPPENPIAETSLPGYSPLIDAALAEVGNYDYGPEQQPL